MEKKEVSEKIKVCVRMRPIIALEISRSNELNNNTQSAWETVGNDIFQLGESEHR
jgi:hypothetical protein